MRIQATANPQPLKTNDAGEVIEQGTAQHFIAAGYVDANGKATPRKLEIDYDLGEGYDGTEEGAANALQYVIAMYGSKAVYGSFIKGAKLPIQQEMRRIGDVQFGEKDGEVSFKTDAEINAHFSGGWMIPEDVPEPPRSDEERATEFLLSLTPEKRQAVLAKYGLKA